MLSERNALLPGGSSPSLPIPRTILLTLALACAGFAQLSPVEADVTNVDVPSCSSPHTAVGTFDVSSQKVVLFFRYNTPPGGSLTVKWIKPDSTVYHNGRWNNTNQYSCFVSTLTIAGTSVVSSPGQWHAQVYSNSALVVNIPFTIGSIPPRGPNYTGSFDAVDCSHISGWAEDTNSPGATLRVDISVDGSYWATVAAGDSRSDLMSVGIGNHAFNEYSLSANLHDGNLHSVRVTFSGTIADLPGSPKNFQNTCGTPLPTNVTVSWFPGFQPPANLTSGQTIQVVWIVTGPANTQSRVIYSATGSPDPTNPQYASQWVTGGNATLYAPITLPAVSRPTPFTFIVQAQSNGQNYLSAAVTQTVNPGGGPGLTGQTWVYNNQTNGSLAGSVVVLQRQQQGSTFHYTWYVVSDSTHAPYWGVDAAELTVLYKNDPSILAKRSTGKVQVLYDTILTPSTATILQNLSTAAWKDISHPALPSNQVDKVLTVLGFTPWGLGSAFDVTAQTNGIVSMLFPDPSLPVVHSSPTFQSLLQQDNYNTVKLSTDNSIANVHGIKLTIDVDEFGGQAPYFMLRLAQTGAGLYTGGGIIGVEVREFRDVPIVTRWANTGIF